MKQFGKGILRSLTILVLIASVSSLGFASIQNATAMPGVIATGLSNKIPPGGTNSINYAGNAGDVPHTGGVVVVTYDADENFVADSAGVWNNAQRIQGVCQFDVTLGTNVWQVQDGNTGNPSFFNIQDTASSIDVTFSTDPSFSANGNSGFTGSPNWKNIADGAAANTNAKGSYTFHVCVQDNGITAAQVDSDGFEVEEPVGGEIISLNTSALLIAGIATNSLWLIPMMGAVAGSAIAVYKLRRNI